VTQAESDSVGLGLTRMMPLLQFRVNLKLIIIGLGWEDFVRVRRVVRGPKQHQNFPVSQAALWAFRPVTVAGCNGPILLVVKRVMTSTAGVRIKSGKPVKLRIQRERK
jgi:hypothetical protein